MPATDLTFKNYMDLTALKPVGNLTTPREHIPPSSMPDHQDFSLWRLPATHSLDQYIRMSKQIRLVYLLPCGDIDHRLLFCGSFMDRGPIHSQPFLPIRSCPQNKPSMTLSHILHTGQVDDTSGQGHTSSKQASLLSKDQKGSTGGSACSLHEQQL